MGWLRSWIGKMPSGAGPPIRDSQGVTACCSRPDNYSAYSPSGLSPSDAGCSAGCSLGVSDVVSSAGASVAGVSGASGTFSLGAVEKFSWSGIDFGLVCVPAARPLLSPHTLRLQSLQSIREFAGLRRLPLEVVGGRFVLLPKHVHQPQFGLRERCRFLSGQFSLHELRN